MQTIVQAKLHYPACSCGALIGRARSRVYVALRGARVRSGSVPGVNMASVRMKPCVLSVLLLHVFSGVVSSLYFHIGETEKKCFIEEIPDETMIIGESPPRLTANASSPTLANRLTEAKVRSRAQTGLKRVSQFKQRTESLRRKEFRHTSSVPESQRRRSSWTLTNFLFVTNKPHYSHYVLFSTKYNLTKVTMRRVIHYLYFEDYFHVSAILAAATWCHWRVDWQMILLTSFIKLKWWKRAGIVWFTDL